MGEVVGAVEVLTIAGMAETTQPGVLPLLQSVSEWTNHWFGGSSAASARSVGSELCGRDRPLRDEAGRTDEVPRRCVSELVSVSGLVCPSFQRRTCRSRRWAAKGR